jgi:DMSO/TMAO reductase YedYZ heme-binding membrane subunit
MENWFTKLAVLTARFVIVGIFTFFYITPLYILFYLIIFQDTELWSEIGTRFYLISYLIGFVINYINIANSLKKDEKAVNKGV